MIEKRGRIMALRPIPEGFEADAKGGLSRRSLERKYRCTSDTLSRWLSHFGIERKKGRKPIGVIRIDPETGGETTFGSVKAAADAVYGSECGIYACCAGRASTAHGYAWRYAEEQP